MVTEEGSSSDTAAGSPGPPFAPELELLHPMWSSLWCPICLTFTRRKRALAHTQENMESLTLCILNLTDQELVKISNPSVSNITTRCGGPEAGGERLGRVGVGVGGSWPAGSRALNHTAHERKTNNSSP